MNQMFEIFNSNIIYEKEIQRILKTRNRSFEQQTVNKKLYEDYKADGWVINKENKETFILRKSKAHYKEFEDRVWSAFAKMGFEQMNGNSPLRLPFSIDEKIPGRKLDVFAADRETALIIECKSAEELKKKNMQTVINDFITVKNGASQFLSKIYHPDKRKIKFILATNNIILSEGDRDRLKAERIEHFNQDDISYYEQLIDKLSVAAKYQLLGRLFKNEEIPQLENKIPAIRGKMGGFTYYSFSLEPEKLLKIGYILHRTETTSEDDGYQRMVSKPRLKEIESFLNDHNNPGFFPNSIIINIATKKEESLNYTLLKGEKHDSQIAEPVILTLPKSYHSAFIIDGQHRLYGYANTDWKYKNSIPVVAFENLPPEKQVDLFVQINSKQKPVSKNLLIMIMADLMWNSDKPKEATDALKSKLLQRLGEKDSSPLYRRIMLTEGGRTTFTNITLDYLITNGFNKSNFFPKYSKGKLISMGHLYVDPSEGYEGMMDKSFLFFSEIFNYMKESLEVQWNLGNSEGGLIATNIGCTITIRIVDDILNYLIKTESILPTSISPIDLAKKTFKWLHVIVDTMNLLDPQKIKQTKNMAASAGGLENAIREYQKQINENYPFFKPIGLEEWVVENSGTFNDSSKDITERIEHAIRNFVFDKLKEVYLDRWWIDGVPKEIQKSSAVIAIDKGNLEPPENFIFLLDYKKIIERPANWPSFKDFFADPQQKSGKDNQVKWFDQLNEIRNKVSHPGRAKVTASEAQFLEELQTWLLERIQND